MEGQTFTCQKGQETVKTSCTIVEDLLLQHSSVYDFLVHVHENPVSFERKHGWGTTYMIERSLYVRALSLFQNSTTRI